jgi:trk system potassium uptake protein
MKKNLILLPVLLSIVSLFLEQQVTMTVFWLVIINLLDVTVLLILVVEIVSSFRLAPYKYIYVNNNVFSLLFTAAFVLLFVYSKIQTFQVHFNPHLVDPSLTAAAFKNTFLVLKVLTRFRRLNALLESISLKPAQTIVLSFLLVILVGALILMIPFTSSSKEGLDFLDALFTATSAVCVTGLIVVDTATAYSLWGHITIMALIQIGGLGIMLLSYFSIFILRRGISRQEKLIAAYMLSQDDLRSIKKTVILIISATLLFEAIGAVMLYLSSPSFSGAYGGRLFAALFHAVSAFCNAGFALFSDSLEGLYGNLLVNGTVAFLIIVGGLSFGVHLNLLTFFSSAGRSSRSGRRLSVNTKVVLIISAGLILGGALIFYALEHSGVLKGLGTGRQYLAAFFQSVTLRTAGFNTIPMGALGSATYLFMCLFMFVGGAAGSTAGGIKVNNLAAMGAYFRSLLRESKEITLFRSSLSSDIVLKSFTIATFGLVTVFLGTFILMLTEDAPAIKILFEAVSAFGTVGLSAGITGDLSPLGKCVIIILMFLGRIGPLTFIAAAGSGQQRVEIRYPVTDLSIG